MAAIERIVAAATRYGTTAQNLVTRATEITDAVARATEGTTEQSVVAGYVAAVARSTDQVAVENTAAVGAAATYAAAAYPADSNELRRAAQAWRTAAMEAATNAEFSTIEAESAAVDAIAAVREEAAQRSAAAVVLANTALERAGETIETLSRTNPMTPEQRTAIDNATRALVAAAEAEANAAAAAQRVTEILAANPALARSRGLMNDDERAAMGAAADVAAEAMAAAIEAERLATEAARVATAAFPPVADAAIQQRFTDAIAAAERAVQQTRGAVAQIDEDIVKQQRAVNGVEIRAQTRAQDTQIQAEAQRIIGLSNRALTISQERRRTAEEAARQAAAELVDLRRGQEEFTRAPNASNIDDINNAIDLCFTNVTGAVTAATTAAEQVRNVATPFIEQANRVANSNPSPDLEVNHVTANLSFAKLQTDLFLKVAQRAYETERNREKKDALRGVVNRIKNAQERGTPLELADINAIQQHITDNPNFTYEGYKVKFTANSDFTLKKSLNGNDVKIHFSAHGEKAKCKISGCGQDVIAATVEAAKMLIQASGPGSHLVSLKLDDKSKLAAYVGPMLTEGILPLHKKDATIADIGSVMRDTYNTLRGQNSEVARQYEVLCMQKQPDAWRRAAAFDSDLAAGERRAHNNLSAGEPENDVPRRVSPGSRISGS